MKSPNSPSQGELSPRSRGQTVVHYAQLSLGCAAVTLLLTWLALLAWDLMYREILIEDYLSGFFTWTVILALLRRFIIFAFARPRSPFRSAVTPDND